MRDTEGLTYHIYSRFGFSDELDGLWFTNVNVAMKKYFHADRLHVIVAGDLDMVPD